MKVTPSGKILGATVDGLDLAKSFSPSDLQKVMKVLGEYGVLRFPHQQLTGLADAGQGWHTDMSYSRMIAFANVLYGIKIPRRDGKPLGATQFSSMHAAYEGLPGEMKERLEGKTVLHDFNKFWEM